MGYSTVKIKEANEVNNLARKAIIGEVVSASKIDYFTSNDWRSMVVDVEYSENHPSGKEVYFYSLWNKDFVEVHI